MTVIADYSFTKRDALKVLCWVAIFLVFDIGISYILLVSQAVEHIYIALPSSVWDISGYLSATYHHTVINRWMALVFFGSIIVATFSTKLIFRNWSSK